MFIFGYIYFFVFAINITDKIRSDFIELFLGHLVSVYSYLHLDEEKLIKYKGKLILF